MRALVAASLLSLVPLASACGAAPPRAVLAVRCPAPDAQLFVDEQYAGIARRPVALPAGAHRLEVRAPGRLSAYRDVQLAPGEHKTLAVELHPDLDEAEPPR